MRTLVESGVSQKCQLGCDCQSSLHDVRHYLVASQTDIVHLLTEGLREALYDDGMSSLPWGDQRFAIKL